MAGRAGQPRGWPVPLPGISTPVRFRRPSWKVGGGDANRSKGVTHHDHPRPEVRKRVRADCIRFSRFTLSQFIAYDGEGFGMSTPMRFPAPASPIYVLASTADVLALTDQFTARQVQLQALLAMTHGNAGDVFRRMDADCQENYLWACAMIAGEMRELTEAIYARRAERREERAGRSSNDD